MDKERLFKMLRLFASNFKGINPKDIDMNYVQGWTIGLEGLSLKQVYDGMRAASRSEEWWPSVAEIRRLALGRTKTDQEIGFEVAGLIDSAVRKCGYQRPDDARAIIGELGWSIVQARGGWETTCSAKNEKEQSFIKKEWEEAAKLASQDRRAKSDLALMGGEAPALPKRHD